MRTRIGWVGAAAALAMPGNALAAGALPGPSARAAAIGDVVAISANSRSPAGSYLRVAILNSGSGTRSPAILAAPVTRTSPLETRRSQYWRVERITVTRSPSFRLRNLHSDKCLTAARAEHSPVYLQLCGDILGQAWFYGNNGMLVSRNYNQTFPAGCPCMTLDITEFRNSVGTRLQVGRIHGKWNQIWDINRIARTWWEEPQ